MVAYYHGFGVLQSFDKNTDEINYCCADVLSLPSERAEAAATV